MTIDNADNDFIEDLKKGLEPMDLSEHQDRVKVEVLSILAEHSNSLKELTDEKTL